MHPAASLIYFTVASGFGFGFLFFLGLGSPDVHGSAAFWRYALGYGLAGTGLCASLLHLGNPQRAWKALSQWRSSWLSREGVVAIAALVLMAPVGLWQIFFDAPLAWLGVVGAALSGLTVYCTAMIYGQLQTVPRWRQPLTRLLFLAFAFTGGALLAQLYIFALVGVLVLIAAQLGHWRLGDRAWRSKIETPESATGLGGSAGKVRLLERPHTGKNYLTHEMVHLIARKHALKLRGLVLSLLALAAVMLLLGGLALWLAAFSLGAGALVSRWLFFAEAEHVVGLYYGRSPS